MDPSREGERRLTYSPVVRLRWLVTALVLNGSPDFHVDTRQCY